ncbi:class C sortase [Vagococcus hydrophili]|uniref:Class C sortase n=1 Tax=Vagococcus hydrophili TaxID=2714947 RepID=A0A6G8AU77_9ENTE|nr:class C sortase [Vagococcus hydrophili]QIL48556.1 class C sortase [Vagococcus hydrophili]
MKSTQQVILLKLLITFTFVTGALIFLYPFVANVINTQIDKQRIEAFQEEALKDEKKQQKKKELREKELKANPQLGMKIDQDLFDEVEESSHLSKKEVKEHLIGSISIPKINSQLPIFDVTNASFLQEGITLLPGASYPSGGKSTHSVLTGHTGLPNKKLFTDLKVLVKGDIIYLHVLGETIGYEVDQIKTVLPNQLDDLKVEKGKDLLTLVTCTPYMINTHRLLVRGHRVPVDLKQVKNDEKEVVIKNQSWLVFYVILILLLLALIVFVSIRQYQSYQAAKKGYRLSIKLTYEEVNQSGLTFLLMDHTKKHPVLKNGKEQSVKTNTKGTLRLGKLRGNTYWLIQQNTEKQPVVIKCFVKNYKQPYFETKLLRGTEKGWKIVTKEAKMNK